MKVPDSGMPEEAYWDSLFDIQRIVEWLGLATVADPIVEIGCGYGTFTVPIASAANATVIAIDIEPAMITSARKNVQRADLDNVRFSLRDVVQRGTGIDPNTAGMVLLFNILHFAERRTMLEEACRILKPAGRAAIIHWRKDIDTPRGPEQSVRPDVQMILDAASGLDFVFDGQSTLLKPYHWGMQLAKGART